jgi:hypothetical protein
MSTRQLDILALEPFYGGGRRIMLETIIRCSRHRWTLLKLPPRRIERRLSTAAIWFAEQLSRHWVGSVDLLFTSEAMNLADLYRLIPDLLKKPAVVYFHSNQLPDPSDPKQSPFDLVNMNTSSAATEIWFNSLFHLQNFLARASALVRRHMELMAHNPMPELTRKSQLMYPPIDTTMLHELTMSEKVHRDKRTIFVETRDANLRILNNAFGLVQRRGEHFNLVTVGPVDGLNESFPRTTLSENDDEAQMRAMLSAGIFFSARPGAPSDHHAVRALMAGCWPLCPQFGVYRELLPESLHSSCLYDGAADTLAGRMQDVWHLDHPSGYERKLYDLLHRFDPIVACKAIDERLELLAQGHAAHAKHAH